MGQRVGLGWQSNSCGECEWCTRGMENLCPAAEGTCVQRNGGYAASVRAHARFVIPLPEALESEGAAPLLCGGITVYNPLRTHRLNPSSRVAWWASAAWAPLHPIRARLRRPGDGIFHHGGQRGRSSRAGRANFVNSRESKALKEIAGTPDLILSTVNADQDWGIFIRTFPPTGTLCFVGVPPSPAPVQAFPLISGQRAISGNPTGTPSRIREMLNMRHRHRGQGDARTT